MVKLKVINDKEQHFTISIDGKAVIEINKLNGNIIAMVYTEKGLLGAYDGTNDSNRNWESKEC